MGSQIVLLCPKARRYVNDLCDMEICDCIERVAPTFIHSVIFPKVRATRSMQLCCSMLVAPLFFFLFWSSTFSKLKSH